MHERRGREAGRRACIISGEWKGHTGNGTDMREKG